MAGFRIGVVAGDGRHELRLVERDARIAENFIHWLNGFRGHHGRGADFIDLQNGRGVAGTEGGNPGAQALLVVAFIDRHNFVIRMGVIKTLRQGVHLFTQLPFH